MKKILCSILSLLLFVPSMFLIASCGGSSNLTKEEYVAAMDSASNKMTDEDSGSIGSSNVEFEGMTAFSKQEMLVVKNYIITFKNLINSKDFKITTDIREGEVSLLGYGTCKLRTQLKYENGQIVGKFAFRVATDSVGIENMDTYVYIGINMDYDTKTEKIGNFEISFNCDFAMAGNYANAALILSYDNSNSTFKYAGKATADASENIASDDVNKEVKEFLSAKAEKAEYSLNELISIMSKMFTISA